MLLHSSRYPLLRALVLLLVTVCAATAAAASLLLTATGVAPTTLVADGSNAYYTGGSSLVYRVPLGGGTPTAISSGAHSLATSIGLSGTSLFWRDNHGIQTASTPSGSPSEVFAVSAGSTISPQTLAVGTTSSGGPDLFLANEITAHLYHVTQTGTVWSATKLLPNTMPSPDQFYYPYSVAIDSANVYMTSFTGELWSLPRSTTTQIAPTTLATGINDRSLLATNGSRVFYVRGADIVSMPVGGGTEATFYAGAGTVTAMALHGGSLYWSSSTTGTVSRRPLASGPAVTLISGVSPATLLAVDSSRMYFALSSSLFSLTP
jgi:hypothetical protein